MKRISKEALASIIDVDSLSSLLDDRIAVVNKLRSVTKKEDSMKKVIKTTLTVIAVVACVCAVAYALYKYLVPDYDDEFDDEFDDAFDDDEDDLFDDDDEESEEKKEEE